MHEKRDAPATQADTENIDEALQGDTYVLENGTEVYGFEGFEPNDDFDEEDTTEAIL